MAAPCRSMACTARYAPFGWTVIAVSNPLLGTEPLSWSESGLVPVSTCHVATFVAPFQLTYTVAPPTASPSVTTSGTVTGVAVHGSRKARYDWTLVGIRPSRRRAPSAPKWLKYGSDP